MERYSGASELPRLLGYFQLHPGLVITIIYLLLSLMGLFFADQYYSHFNVPILQYSEFTDLLAVGYRQPMALLMLASAIALSITIDSLGCWAKSMRSKYEGKSKFNYWLMRIVFPIPKYRISAILTNFGALFLFLWLFVYFMADYKANIVQESGEYNISVVQGGETTMGYLLGTTFNYIFIYDPMQQEAKIFTIEGVDRMTPVAPKREASD